MSHLDRDIAAKSKTQQAMAPLPRDGLIRKALRCMGRHGTYAILVVATAGCGTYYNQKGYWEGPPENKSFLTVNNVWVYGGTLQDLYTLPAWLGMSLFDLPISMVADTALLPLTIWQQLVGRPDPESLNRRDEGLQGSGGSANSSAERGHSEEASRTRRKGAAMETSERVGDRFVLTPSDDW